MAGRGYTIFDTESADAASHGASFGIVGVQLPEAREIETRGRMLRQYPEAREARPPLNVESRSRASSRCCAASPAIFPTSRST
jgi:methylated-DNA-[protein]-cysteine S-methyltransferase